MNPTVVAFVLAALLSACSGDYTREGRQKVWPHDLKSYCLQYPNDGACRGEK